MTFAFKILLCFVILQSRYQNGETGCCPAKLLHWNCGCNIFNCNCNWNPDDDYCYYIEWAITTNTKCEKSDEIASARSLRRPALPLKHQPQAQAQKTPAFKKAIERVIKVNNEN